MHPSTLMFVIFSIRLVAAVSMLGLYGRLRSPATALLAAGLSAFALAPGVGLLTEDYALTGPTVVMLHALTAVLLLLGFFVRFGRPTKHQWIAVAVASGLAAGLGLLLPFEGHVHLGSAILFAAGIYAVVVERASFTRIAGSSYYGAIGLLCAGLALNLMRVLRPAFMGSDLEQLAMIGVSGAFGLYLVGMEFSIAFIALDQAQRRYRTLFDAAGDILLVSDLDGNVLDANESTTEKLGYPLEKLRTMTISEIDSPDSAAHVAERIAQIHARGRAVFESEHVRSDGVHIPVEINAAAIEWDGAPANLGVCRDISERKHNEETITRMAYYDPLTGLANRRLATDRLNQAIAHANRTNELIALLFLDLDQFKSVNDTLGHTVGDELLIAVGDRLSRLVREGDTVARLGGDEFMLIAMDMASKDAASAVAWKVLDALREPYRIDGHEIHTTASMGIAVFEAGASSAMELLRDADIAMYKAKDRGRNTYQYHDPELNAAALDRFRMKGDVRRALENDEFTIHYQPQVRVADGRIVGAEALLRWTHPELGAVSPADFIPIAEEAGLIGEIGSWVMRNAAAQARQWHDAGHRDLRIAVNVSARQFTAIGFVDEVGAVLTEAGLRSDLLEVEITESIAMRHSEIIAEVFRALAELGVHIAIDDFGTGHSSLERLGTFPINTLKIAKPFIDPIGTDVDRSVIARTIILLAKSMHLNVVAEGVETQAQLDFLKEHECPQMQGFHYSPAVPAEEFTALLQRDGA